MITYTATDIDRKLAYEAHRNTSHTPDRRAQSIIDSYLAEMTELVKEFEAYATADNRTEIANSLEYYRQGYLKRLHAYLSAHSRVASAFIVGPAKFPTERNRKRSETADKRRDEWLDWSKKTLERLRRTYNPQIAANAPVSADDPDAVEKLKTKLTHLERQQEFMKVINKIVKSKKMTTEDKISALGKLDISAETAGQFLAGNELGQIGFPSWQLQNNNANIRRIRQRITDLERQQAERETSQENPAIAYPGGIQLVENLEINRIQIVFPGKPEASIRQTLKQNGFRWSPRQGAWQRQLNTNGKWAAERVLETIGATND